MLTKKGFTLIELIMIIVILGILAAIAIPRYYDLQSDAKNAAEKGIVGGVRAGIMTYYAQNKTYPTALDSSNIGACNATNACFTNVLAQGGVTADWQKNNTNAYAGPTGQLYNYTNSNGEFK